ncbi:MAG: inositol monophosphatase [Rhodospirillales bacterium]|nr:inositol monophosphatase [Rhodospirillales bacterium]
MANRSAVINVMVAAAQNAAQSLVRDIGEIENLQVSKKGPADFVSTADTTAEKSIVADLQKARPKFGFLLEEGGEIIGEDTSHRWIIDPLDGTTNFLHGIPHFAISIALERNKEIIAGVVYEPVHNEMFWAEKGAGAFLNGRRIRVAGRTDMADSIFATGIPFFGRPGHKLFLKQAEVVMAQSAGIRRFGVASLDLAYVAAGRFDGFWECGLKPWDIAAGSIIVREAGGYCTGVTGKKDEMVTGDILAANDVLHTKLQRILKKISKEMAG